MIGSPDGVDDLLDLYNATLLGLLNKHAPEKEKVLPDRPSSPWINEAVIKAKQARRRAERKKRKTGLVVHIEIYKQAMLINMLDHFLLTIGTDLSRPRVPRKVVKCRNVKVIDRSLFRAD